MTRPAKSSTLIDARPPAPATPRYQVIYDDLKARITDGEYDISARLPSENELMLQYDVSRVTVRHALQRLQDENFIASQRGKGRFVIYPKAIQNLGRLLGLGESLSASDMEVSSRVLCLGEVAAGPDVATALGLKAGGPVTCLERLRCFNGRPVSFDTSYFPIEIGRYLGDFDLERLDVFVLIESHLGLELSVADLVIKVSDAEPEIADKLQVDPGDAVVQIERLTRDSKGRPIDFEYLNGRRDAFQFKIRVPRW